MRKPFFAYAKTKTQINFAVTAILISAFVFATQIVESLFFLYPKLQASSHLLWLYSLTCVGPGQNPRNPVFSERGSNDSVFESRWGITITHLCNIMRLRFSRLKKMAFFKLNSVIFFLFFLVLLKT